MTPPETAPRGKRALQLALGIAISAAVVWYTFRKTDWAASWQYMVAADRLWMFLAVVLATLPFPLRVPRWRWLLHHEDGNESTHAYDENVAAKVFGNIGAFAKDAHELLENLTRYHA